MLDKGLDKGRLCVEDWRLTGFSWRYSNILEIVWAFSVFWSRPKHSLPRSGGNAFTTPRGSTWVDLNCIWFVIVLDSCCISKRLSRVYKGQTGFKFRGLCFRVFWGLCFRVFGCFVFEIWVLRFRDLGASFSRFVRFVLRSSFSKLPLNHLLTSARMLI